jgi:N-acylglucosamine-6-phosphate 2-epimerase
MLKKASLIVSCQANPGSPFDNPLFIRAFAQAAKLGGASAFRLQGIENITAVRKDQRLPIIGLIKRRMDDYDVYITPEPSDVEDIIQAGADIVAFDATLRKRPTAIADMIDVIHQQQKLAMADISTAIEAIAALDAGADYVSSTLSGYTNYSPKLEGPDLELISDLSMHGIEVIAEGRIRTPAEAREALARGAFAVVIGSAITRPEVITSWFSQEMQKCSTLNTSEPEMIDDSGQVTALYQESSLEPIETSEESHPVEPV